jgi:type IX secretion system PorP/SprF family membrane protein
MIMKKIFIFILTLAIVDFAFSQQEYQFTQNMFNHFGTNPGYAGFNKAICVNLQGRNQWMGFGGEPKTYQLTIDGYVNPLMGGLGLTVYKDILGASDRTYVKGAYAYNFIVGKGNLGIGLQLGLLNEVIDFSKFKAFDANDPVISSKSKASDMFFDLNFGVFYEIQNKIYFGASSTQMIEGKGFKGFSETNAVEQNARHYYFTAGYTFNASSKIDVLPSVFVKSDGASTQFDLSALVLFDKKFWGGASYRYQDAVAFLVGMYFKSYKIGLSYDFTTSEIGKNNYSNGSWEVMASYCFKIVPVYKPTGHHTTRFL